MFRSYDGKVNECKVYVSILWLCCLWHACILEKDLKTFVARFFFVVILPVTPTVFLAEDCAVFADFVLLFLSLNQPVRGIRAHTSEFIIICASRLCYNTTVTIITINWSLLLQLLLLLKARNKTQAKRT